MISTLRLMVKKINNMKITAFFQVSAIKKIVQDSKNISQCIKD